jgi:DNA polymerase-3 subunit epsilon
VTNALEDLLNNDSYIIKEKGRDEREEAIIMVKNGIYQGFSYVPKNKKINSFSNYEALIDLRNDNIDIQRIIRSYLNKNSVNMIKV